MRIKIVDTSVCLSCRSLPCTYIDAIVKESFYALRSETTICPTAVLTDGMSSKTFVDGILTESDCVECGLCVSHCIYGNLEAEEINLNTDSFSNLSEPQYNAIVSSYLGCLFAFAANTNRNKSINFDGYIQTISGDECFVEVDWEDDSLESCRRILGDFILYSKDSTIRKGLIVLRNIPREGSRDVYDLISRIKQMPSLASTTIFITTFAILRYLSLRSDRRSYEFSDLFFDPTTSFDDYALRMNRDFELDL